LNECRIPVKGAKKPIEQKDVPLPISSNRTKNNMSSIETEWNKELKKKRPSLFLAMFRANFWIIPRIMFISAFGYGARTMMPFVLSELIDWFSEEEADAVDAYLLALLYGGLALAASWILAPMLYQNMTDGHILRCQLCALLYKKCVNMNAEVRRAITIGKIVNIMSVDVGRCDRIFLPFSQVFFCPMHTWFNTGLTS